MANSGIPWIDMTFDWCVRLLIDGARLMGITYEEINIWIFVVGWPLATAVMVAVIVWQWRQIRGLRRISG